MCMIKKKKKKHFLCCAATVFNNANQHINVYGDDVEVDYRGYEVRKLTDCIPSLSPPSKLCCHCKGFKVLLTC